jgi:hypothetical protein
LNEIRETEDSPPAFRPRVIVHIISTAIVAVFSTRRQDSELFSRWAFVRPHSLDGPTDRNQRRSGRRALTGCREAPAVLARSTVCPHPDGRAHRASIMFAFYSLDSLVLPDDGHSFGDSELVVKTPIVTLGC